MRTCPDGLEPPGDPLNPKPLNPYIHPLTPNRKAIQVAQVVNWSYRDGSWKQDANLKLGEHRSNLKPN